MKLPAGVRVVEFATHSDSRGDLTEIFRGSWVEDLPFRQWNVVHSIPRTLRGVHVHLQHHDFLVLLSGRVTYGLVDLRPGSPTELASAFVEAARPAEFGLYIPPGVAHGFYFHEPSLHVYGVTHYWSMTDELGCRFDDPELRLAWPDPKPILSPRDQALSGLAEIRSLIPPYSPALA